MLSCRSPLPTLGTRGFSLVRREFSVLAEGRHVFGRRPKVRAAKPREKPLARSGAFYRPRWPLSFFIGLHLRQSDWKSPTVIMWAGTWRNVQRPTLSLENHYPWEFNILLKTLTSRAQRDKTLQETVTFTDKRKSLIIFRSRRHFGEIKQPKTLI